MPRDVRVESFGCRLNLVESEAMRRLAGAAGGGDLVIVNTCAVTGEAVRQARQTIRRLRRERPAAEIVVTGCAAETETATFAAMPEVSRVVGNAEKLAGTIWGNSSDGRRVAVAGIGTAGAAALIADAIEGHTRAFVQVQTGCDHACTFCIIPLGRGRARSVPVADAVAAIARLVDQGFEDVTLTGVDLTSYGADLAGRPALGDLVAGVLDGVPGLRRLRLSSLDVAEADERLIGLFAGDVRLAPYLHLSLQAGDDLILKRMKRRHSRADAVAFCARLRALRPDIVFGADLITGFPTETEAMFERTLDLVDDCGLTHLHVFPYSPRPGTPAARMPAVAAGVAKARATRLRARGEAALAAHLERQRRRTVEVLSERGGFGRTADFTSVRLGPEVPAGRWLTGRVAGHDGRHLALEPLPLVAPALTG